MTLWSPHSFRQRTYQLESTRDLITNEHLGKGGTTDLLVVSLSAYDIIAHKVGPDSPEMVSMTLTLDQQLAGFFSFLDKEVGLANTWIALMPTMGAAPMPEFAASLHLPARRIDENKLPATLQFLARRDDGKTGRLVKLFSADELSFL